MAPEVCALAAYSGLSISSFQEHLLEAVIYKLPLESEIGGHSVIEIVDLEDDVYFVQDEDNKSFSYYEPSRTELCEVFYAYFKGLQLIEDIYDEKLMLQYEKN